MGLVVGLGVVIGGFLFLSICMGFGMLESPQCPTCLWVIVCSRFMIRSWCRLIGLFGLKTSQEHLNKID